MQKGMTLSELTELIDYQNENKRDFIVNTEHTVVRVDPDNWETGAFLFTFSDDSRKKGRIFTFSVSRYMLTQISAHTGVPMKLIDTMSIGTDQERNEIAKVLSVRLRENPVTRMIRTMAVRDSDNRSEARAFLSDRYRVLDNYDLLQAIFPVIQAYKGKLKIESTCLTGTHLYLKLRFPTISGSLGTVRDIEGVKVNDIVEGGVLITNSEVGDGPISIRPYLVRLVCLNGATVMMTRRGKRRNHIGRKLVNVDASQVLDDSAVFTEAADEVRSILRDKEFFRDAITMFRYTKRREITGDMEAVFRALGRRYQLLEREIELIAAYLGRGKTQFALINAVTRAAGSRKNMTYDRSTELEAIGGRMIELTDREWKTIGSAKNPKDVVK